MNHDCIELFYCRVTGATIVNDACDLREEDVGTQADLFEITKIGDEYYVYVTSEKTTAVTVLLRGPSKDVINEVERNLQDAMNVVRNVMQEARLMPGGGAAEMALAQVRNFRLWYYANVRRRCGLVAKSPAYGTGSAP